MLLRCLRHLFSRGSTSRAFQEGQEPSAWREEEALVPPDSQPGSPPPPSSCSELRPATGSSVHSPSSPLDPCSAPDPGRGLPPTPAHSSPGGEQAMGARGRPGSRHRLPSPMAAGGLRVSCASALHAVNGIEEGPLLCCPSGLGKGTRHLSFWESSPAFLHLATWCRLAEIWGGSGPVGPMEEDGLDLTRRVQFTEWGSPGNSHLVKGKGLCTGGTRAGGAAYRGPQRGRLVIRTSCCRPCGLSGAGTRGPWRLQGWEKEEPLTGVTKKQDPCPGRWQPWSGRAWRKVRGRKQTGRGSGPGTPESPAWELGAATVVHPLHAPCRPGNLHVAPKQGSRLQLGQMGTSWAQKSSCHVFPSRVLAQGEQGTTAARRDGKGKCRESQEQSRVTRGWGGSQVEAAEARSHLGTAETTDSDTM